MKGRGILFSAPMVAALLAGRKTQTRRVVKGFEIAGPNRPGGIFDVFKGEEKLAGTANDTATRWRGAFGLDGHGNAEKLCPYGAPGDRLWVRESFWSDRTTKAFAWYVTPGLTGEANIDRERDNVRLTPGIHMPRSVARINLEVVKVRVERLFDISEEDCRAEGMLQVPNGWSTDEGQPVSETARRAYEDLWHSINGAWLDCWVWVIEFRRRVA